MAAVERDSAIVIHGRRFRENSRILEIFTASHGRIAAVARVPKKNAHRVLGHYQAFNRVFVTWSGQSELQSLRSMEPVSQWKLTGKAGVCGLYCNELLLCLTQKSLPMESLYSAYGEALTGLEVGKELALVLRKFEFSLLDELGYLPVFNEDCLTGEVLSGEGPFHFHPSQGVSFHSLGPGERLVPASLLKALAEEDFAAKSTAKGIKLILGAVISHLLNGRVLKSKSLINSLSQHCQ